MNEADSLERYHGESSDLIRQHGYFETFRIMTERRKEAMGQLEPTQGDSSELSPSEWQRQIEANKRSRP